MKKGTSKCRGRHMLEAPPKRGRYHFRGGANVKRTTLKVALGWKKPPFLARRQAKWRKGATILEDVKPLKRGASSYLEDAPLKGGAIFGGRAPILEEVVKSRPSLEEGPRFVTLTHPSH